LPVFPLDFVSICKQSNNNSLKFDTPPKYALYYRAISPNQTADIKLHTELALKGINFFGLSAQRAHAR